MLKDCVVIDAEFDEFTGLDAEAKEKAIKKRELSDKKKVDKVEEAKKKSEENLKRAEEKKKRRLSKDDTPLPEPATSAAEANLSLSGFSLTQQRLEHGMTPSTTIVTPIPGINECVLVTTPVCDFFSLFQK